MATRRLFIAGAAAAALTVPRTGSARGSAADLRTLARTMAGRPHVPWRRPLPPPFADLTYDSYRGIRPLRGRAAMLPLGDSFAYDLLPPGFYYTEPVTVELARDGIAEPVPFSTRHFTFDKRYFADTPQVPPGSTGYSGLRLRHPLNAPDTMDEVLVMQGASYFRAIGQAMGYGLSARTVALGTGMPGPEEFPRFICLRLTPATQGGSPLIEGVIDGPSLTAHLAMSVAPGRDTVTSRKVQVFPRRDLDAVGIAPLTSMYFKGPIRGVTGDDYRPAVHDSDALWIENGAGEVLWRPLANPATIQISAFMDRGPRGFALVQTPRSFEAFEDDQAAYHRRPTARVVPHGDWGAGAVTLVEIPTGTEFMDNIVAFWRPDAPLVAGGSYSFDYDIVWTKDLPAMGGLAPVIHSRSGRVHDRPGALRYVIDFAMAPPSGDLSPEITATGATALVDGIAAYALPDQRRYRVSFMFVPGDEASCELRLILRDGQGVPRTPVWLHRWTPARDGGP